MTAVELDQLLARALGDVPVAARDCVAASAEIVEVAPGGRVFSEGDAADALYLVASGTVRLSVHQRHLDLAVASLGAGEALGWSWLVPPQRWDFDAVSPGGATLVRIPADELASVMRDDPAVAAALTDAMLRVVSRRLRDTRIQLLDLLARRTTGVGP